ncbi:MAG: LuxR C-terminal-related transcriptional regulator [Pedobacter sp.]|uniref:LuxR C-terminal-related transcriptional regulator n=1 Tax=Pedobacter sp. TaxID=1411316 RepID=UPI0028090BF2|nr:LuxR C-terminal-related transcriptional regulator [Pedobacter sp.]MDQ8005141.1 LuxR C-terminal-related transcriptional regulator [Pedobacter sp.]
MLKHSGLIFLMFFGLALNAQSTNEKQIKEYLKKSRNYNIEYNYLKALEFSKLAYDLSKKDNNKLLIAESAYKMAASASYLGLSEQALQYAEEAKQNCPDDDVQLKAIILEVYASTYDKLGMRSESLKMYHECAKLIASLSPKNRSDSLNLASAYYNIADHYTGKSAKIGAKFIKLADEILILLPEDQMSIQLSYFSYYRSKHLLEAGESKKAYAEMKSAESLLDKYKNPVKHMVYMGYAKYYAQQKKYKEALKYYLETVRIMEENSIQEQSFSDIDKLISDTYTALGNEEKANIHLKKQADFDKKITEKQKNATDSAIKILMKDKEEEHWSKQKKLILSLIFAGIILTVLAFLYIKNQNKTEKFKTSLEEKEEVVQELTQKVNESFDEVVKLAKENSPKFWPRFQEVYPSFLGKMLILSAKLTTAELTIAAHIYLGFTTKEISTYTFRSPKTVETIRYNLRKKMELPSDDNLTVWLRNYVNSKT